MKGEKKERKEKNTNEGVERKQEIGDKIVTKQEEEE